MASNLEVILYYFKHFMNMSKMVTRSKANKPAAETGANPPSLTPIPKGGAREITDGDTMPTLVNEYANRMICGK